MSRARVLLISVTGRSERLQLYVSCLPTAGRLPTKPVPLSTYHDEHYLPDRVHRRGMSLADDPVLRLALTLDCFPPTTHRSLTFRDSDPRTTNRQRSPPCDPSRDPLPSSLWNGQTSDVRRARRDHGQPALLTPPPPSQTFSSFTLRAPRSAFPPPLFLVIWFWF